MKRLIAKLALVAMLACAATSWAYFPFGYFKKDGSGFIPVHYDLSKLPNSTLTFHINTDGLWLLPDNHPRAALFGDLKAALDAWNVSTSALRLRPGGFTHLTKLNGPAGLVSFTPQIPPGIAVLAGYETGPLPTDDSVPFVPITASYIKLPHLVDELGAYGLVNAMAAGVGHSIGLNHSHIMGMRTQVIYINNPARLSADDVAGISSLYPTDDFDKITGQYAGWVTGPDGAPIVLGAVTAYNDSVAIGTYTNPDGTFLIRGLPPGPYRLFIEPLMGGSGAGATDPNLIGPQTKLGGGAVSPSLGFGANFLDTLGEYAYSESAARLLDVPAGTRVYARIWGVPVRGNLGMDAFDAASRPSGQSWTPAVWVQRGGTVSAFAGAHQMVKLVADPITQQKVPTVAVGVGFTGSGLTVSNLTGSLDTSAPPPWYDSSLSFTVSAAADATPGLRSIIYRAVPDPDKPGPPELYFSAGYVHVVADPPPHVTGVSPTLGTGGTIVTITGSGFTDSSKVSFDGLPVTVVSRTPTSLVVTAPRGAAGHASGIFVTNADGQGSDFDVNAGVSLVDGRPKDLTNLVRFTYDPAIPAPGIAVAPASVISTQELLIQVAGTNTHFVQDQTFLGFGSGDMVVNSVTVTSSTSLAADVTVNAKVGEDVPLTVVTGEEVASLQNAFVVGPPTIAVAPTSVTKGQRLLIQVTGNWTHFVQGQTVVGFGSANMLVNSVTVNSPTSLAADVTVRANVGESVQVTVTTGQEVASLQNAFVVVAPSIAVAPTGVTKYDRILLQVTGTNTHFVQGQTVVSFGLANVVVNSVTVTSPTSLAADVTVMAHIGESVQVTVATGEEVASLGNAFVVLAPPPPVIAVAPTIVTKGQRLLIQVAGTNTHFVQDQSVVGFGSSNVAVNSVTVTSGTSLTANVIVRAEIGESVQVTVRTGEEVASLGNAFVVVAPEIAVAPTSVTRGPSFLLRVIGTNTHFVQGQTAVGLSSADVVINSVTVTSPTSLAVDVAVNAKIGEVVQVTVTTGEEVSVLKNALRVVPVLPLALDVVSGNSQIGAAGSQLPGPLVVRAHDAAGSSLIGTKVTFSVQAGGGTVSPTSALTDDNGQASTILTLGKAVGFNAVVATADQFPSAGFVLAGGGVAAANLQLGGSGDSQSAMAGQELPNPLVLTVMDAKTGSPLAGFPITWQVTRGGGVVTPAFTLTDATGTATARWTLGPTSGTQTLEATLSGFSPIVFKANAQGAAGAPAVRANGVVNAAALDTVPRSISPGGLVSIFGAGLFPAQTGASPGFWPGSDQIRTLFGGTEVTFDGVRGPILYARGDQLNVQVPFEVGGNSTVQMVVTVGGIRSNTVALDVQPAGPGLFTADSTGRGAAAALNPDNSPNSASSPVSRGQVIQLFTTGLGPLGPPVATGRAMPSGALLPLSVYVPSVTIGGISASVEYAGLAPGYVGLWQVNVLVPSNAPTGEQPVLIETCGQRSNTATVSIR